MIPDPRRGKKKDGDAKPWEPVEPGPVEGPELPDEPPNVVSPSNPLPKRPPTPVSAGKKRRPVEDDEDG